LAQAICSVILDGSKKGGAMPRFARRHARVRELVERRLVPLFLVEGSVNALCERLNQALRAREQPGVVYPNRVHGLFNDDDGQAINEATLVVLESAASAAWTDPRAAEEKVEEAAGKLRAALLKQAGSGQPTFEAATAAAEQFGYPPAVTSYLIERAHLGIGPAERSRPSLPPARRGVPDWSFQDKACEQCLAALARGRARRVGLVLPTGAGKTRVALRIALSYLARHPGSTAPVVWVTHRRSLRRQAHRELQKMLAAGASDLPPDAAALLAKRIEFRMVSELEEILADTGNLPLLLILDEAHHAAARSYEPIFRGDLALPGLFLTATPNRTDALPIGIDEIAFTITYSELAKRGVILMPEFRDFPVESFTWSEESVEDLADYVITHTANGFRKVLVLAPRLDQVEEFYKALLMRLAREDNHPLSPDDIGYVHSRGNSLGCETDDFLLAFEPKPRAILVSAQLLLEGFDDPGIDTVVITYPSESLIVLMQAAGRCVRFAPGKKAAYVVQAKNEKLAYHFDQRWLYQEISDYLRPELIDVGYRSRDELVAAVTTMLERHRVAPAVRQRVLERLQEAEPGDPCRLLLTGLPYYGAKVHFESEAKWGAVLELSDNSEAFRSIFNQFSAEGAALSDPTNFLAHVAPAYGIPRDPRPASEWRGYMEMLLSMFRAGQEVYGGKGMFQDQDHRPYEPFRSTTWLKYVVFHYRPSVPTALDAFLQDCYNREATLAAYQAAAEAYALLIKIPLPLDGFEAHLLGPDAAAWLRSTLAALRSALLAAPPAERCSVLDAERARLPGSPLPLRVVARLEWLLPDEGFSALSLALPPDQGGLPAQADPRADALPESQDPEE
jgi:superfamily II DNA or RNA helicase